MQTRLNIAGIRWLLSTSSDAVRDSLRQFAETDRDSTRPEITLNVEVGGKSGSLQPTLFRGADHLVFARYGDTVFLLDLLRRSVHGWVPEDVASDVNIWTARFVPMFVGVLGCTVGVLPLHSACVAAEGQGILIAGESMAGKSTLSVALAKQGCAFLSDDWTYIRAEGETLVAHGLPAPVKLLADATSHFPELLRFKPRPTANGEVGFEFSAAATLKLDTLANCNPTLMLFLERAQHGRTQTIPVQTSYVQQYVNNSVDRLPELLHTAAHLRQQIINSLSTVPAWRLIHAGRPEAVAADVIRFVQEQLKVIR